MNANTRKSTLIGVVVGIIVAGVIVLIMSSRESPEIRRAEQTYHEALEANDHMTAYMICAEMVHHYEAQKNEAKIKEWTTKGQKEMPYVWGTEVK